MTIGRFVLPGTLAACLVAAGCGSDKDSSSPQGDGGGGGGTSTQVTDPSPATQSVLQATKDYKTWPTFTENATPKMSASHMKMYVVTYHNDVVGTAITSRTLPLPDGALIVKENMAKATDSMPMALTIMSKQGGKWYWVEATPDGKVILDPEGKPLEGTDVAMCVGCHSTQSSNDSVYTHTFN